MTPFVSVTLQNHLSELERLYEIVRQCAEGHQLSEIEIHAINLALEEIVTNVIEHGYADKDQHSIVIRISIQEEKVIAEVEDDARPFNPLLVPEPDVSTPLHDRPIGGLGIHIVRNIMDDLDYVNKEGKNCIRLIKRIGR